MSSEDTLGAEERRILLALARAAVEAAAAGEPPAAPDLETLPPSLGEPRAVFVSLHTRGDHALRGCTGVLHAQRPLAEEVVRTAVQTALADPRFPPVAPGEVAALDIEISVLTPPEELDIPAPDDLPGMLRPGVDGVTLYHGPFRATFLPQVWERVPDALDFLALLSRKMGLSREAWRDPGICAEVYQVEDFSEETKAESG